jgi:hypothetical protein
MWTYDCKEHSIELRYYFKITLYVQQFGRLIRGLSEGRGSGYVTSMPAAKI